MVQSTPLRRGIAGLAALCTLAVVAARGVGPTVQVAYDRIGRSDVLPVDVVLASTLVTLGAAAVTLAWGWLLLCVLVALHDSVGPRRGAATPVAGGPFRPALLRGVLGVACLGAGTLAVPAHAVEPHGPVVGHHAGAADATTLEELLDGLLLPDRVTDDGPDPRPPHPPGRPERPSGDTTVVRVRPGDTLWGLADQLLTRHGATVTAGEVSEAWRLLHRANRAELGPDPDLIRPGTLLRVPSRFGATGVSR